MFERSNNHNKNSELSSLFFVLLLCWVSFLTACSRSASQQVEVLSGATMGTYYRITISGAVNLDFVGLQAEIETILERINQSMSTYMSDSEVNRVSQSKAQQPMKLSDDLLQVLSASLQVAQDSKGFFDPTIGPLVRLWGFGPDSSESVPEAEEIETKLSAVGYQKLSLSGQYLQKSQDAVELDLSAVAKGYAIDQIAEHLEALAVHDWLIDIGGELRASGSKAGQLWQVAIEIPQPEGGVYQVLALQDQAIATSGDYRNYRELDGRRFSHAISPKTGYPIQDSLASVTVMHSSAMLADAHATAMLVLGEQMGLRYANENSLSTLLISRDMQGGFYTKATGKFLSLAD